MGGQAWNPILSSNLLLRHIDVGAIDMMSDGFQAPTPDIAEAFTFRVERGTPFDIGGIATGGKRSQIAVTGGSVEGEGLSGEIVGGSELLLERADGVGDLEVNYYIALKCGAHIRCFGKGYRTPSSDFTGTRVTLMFEAAEDGPAAHLATRAFIAEQMDSSDIMTVFRII